MMMYSGSCPATLSDRLFFLINPTEKSLWVRLDILDSQSSSLRVSGTDAVDCNCKRIILKGVSEEVQYEYVKLIAKTSSVAQEVI